MTVAEKKPGMIAEPKPWSNAVVYQVYVRSFRDGNGDGIGDLAGLRAGLVDIAGLGCDAIWLNPCYVSPQRDHGYDVADYFAPDPAYGSLEEFDAMVAEAHSLGLRVLMDIVPNHCSSEHQWFKDAVAAAPGSPERERFLFRDGRGENGEEPPGNWESVFGGTAWTRITEPDGQPGQWYLHSFDPGQPDFNWRNPKVVEYFLEVLRFWFDRGVDGFRVDVAHGNIKHPDLPDQEIRPDGTRGHNDAMWDQPEVQEIYRGWRSLGDSYVPARHFVGEVWVPPERLSSYINGDGLHSAFSFDLLVQPWNAPRLVAAINSGLESAGGEPAWTLSNHDVHRPVTRYGQEQVLEAPLATDMIAAARRIGPVDLELGHRRARAAAAMLLALPGTIYLYQGDELGLPEVWDLPDDARQDPIWTRSAGAELGRDGCRVPLPWVADDEGFGFGAGNLPTWLPQPSWFGKYARDIQQGSPESMLTLYRRLLHERDVFSGPVEWLETGVPEVLAFRRGPGICVVNTGDSAFTIPDEWSTNAVLVATVEFTHHQLPADSAVWLSSN